MNRAKPRKRSRRIKVEGQWCRTIPLSNGMIVTVDEVDYPSLSRFPWCCMSPRHKKVRHYAMRYRRMTEPGYPESVLMHREILGLRHDQHADHINGNTLDNRRCNLRTATARQNSLNRRPIRGKFKGVILLTIGRKTPIYQGRIMVHAKPIHLGSFRDPISAAKAYDKAARKYFGKFAFLNFPRSEVQK